MVLRGMAQMHVDDLAERFKKLVVGQAGSAAPRATGAAGDAISQAQQAIARGASKEAVIRRLQQLGITDHGIQ